MVALWCSSSISRRSVVPSPFSDACNLPFRLRDDSDENLLSNPLNIRKSVLGEKNQILRLCRCKSTTNPKSQRIEDFDTEVVCEPSGLGDQCARMYAKVKL